ncbi:uncharacterized protein [Zea mays]|uniref:uncharacterized protein n=1 Tax=Zea mays TaxID=4577 RepID=UPI0004DEC81E|nr:uncharacterized protein LOC103645881 [Zea mays]|eukprot:XP_008668815.1 uncharacterized protein LOC103645881 [Zea mays]
MLLMKHLTKMRRRRKQKSLQTRDFCIIRQEWTVVRIQSAFHAFLVGLPAAFVFFVLSLVLVSGCVNAWRALRALRGIVRLQALVRGCRVRKQLAIMQKCMNALLKVQEHGRDRCF